MWYNKGTIKAEGGFRCMEIKITAEKIVERKKKIQKEYAAINKATQEMYKQLEDLMPIIMDDEQTLPTDYTFEPEVIRAVNLAGYGIIPDPKINALFLRIIE